MNDANCALCGRNSLDDGHLPTTSAVKRSEHFRSRVFYQTCLPARVLRWSFALQAFERTIKRANIGIVQDLTHM